MAQGPQDLLSKLADRGEEVIGRIGDIPGAQRLLEQASTLKERTDELQKKLRGLDDLERRVEALERKVDQLSKPASKSRAAGQKKATTAKRLTAPKPKPKSP
jgi:DNA repair ATPase RecN